MEVAEDLRSSFAKSVFQKVFRNLSMGQFPDAHFIGELPSEKFWEDS
jgi:hypothetical protein